MPGGGIIGQRDDGPPFAASAVGCEPSIAVRSEPNVPRKNAVLDPENGVCGTLRYVRYVVPWLGAPYVVGVSTGSSRPLRPTARFALADSMSTGGTRSTGLASIGRTTIRRTRCWTVC